MAQSSGAPTTSAAVPATVFSTGGNGTHTYIPPAQEYAAPRTAAEQADSDYALALQLQQAEDENALRYTPSEPASGQPGDPQSTLQGAVVRPRSGGGLPPAPVGRPQGGGLVLAAPPVNDGPRRFSGARQSGPVYIDPNVPQGGQGRPGSGRGGRTQQSADSCTIM